MFKWPHIFCISTSAGSLKGNYTENEIDNLKSNSSCNNLFSVCNNSLWKLWIYFSPNLYVINKAVGILLPCKAVHLDHSIIIPCCWYHVTHQYIPSHVIWRWDDCYQVISIALRDATRKNDIDHGNWMNISHISWYWGLSCLNVCILILACKIFLKISISLWKIIFRANYM